MKLAERYKQPTPKFFKTLRNIGIALAAVGGAIIAAPVALPAIVITVAGYLAVAGTVATAVSQAVVIDDESDGFGNNLKKSSPETDFGSSDLSKGEVK
jgi:hypothetical protein